MAYFSIIIPVYNKAAFVGKTLKSVLDQTFGDYEIILVNDGSTDESEHVIHSIQDDRIAYFRTANQGVAAARNFGLSKAKSDFICFLDADDYWYPSFLEVIKATIEKNPGKKVFAAAIAIETSNKTFPARYSIVKTGATEIVDFFDASQKECVLWTSSAVFHKSVFENVGIFDTNIKKGEDTELWIRIGLEYPIVFIWNILAKYIYDNNSVSRNLNYFFEPYTFEKYALAETKNAKLKQYLDLNRFSGVIKSKLNGDFGTAKTLHKAIDLDNIGWKKTMLLRLPGPILKLLVGFKNSLAKIGLAQSVFR